jgi:hypothetical protein
MTPRERLIAGAVIGLLALVAVVFLVHQLYLTPLREREASISTARQDIDTKQEQLRQIRADLPRLERWRQLSLPADVDLAGREYEKYLSDLLRESDFEGSVTPKPPDTRTSPQLPGKKPIYTRLTFNVIGHASLDGLVKMLDRFYRTGLLHEVKNLSIQRSQTTGSQQRPNDLDINLTIEALILQGADHRRYLLPNIDQRMLAFEALTALRGGPGGLALAVWAAGPTGPLGPGRLAIPERNYTAIANKNIFLGPPPPKERPAEEAVVSRFVYLTDISGKSPKYQAFLYDRYNNHWTRLRSSRGFDAFRVTDNEGKTIIRGTVVRIEARELVFKAEDKFYVMHVGQNMEEAMGKSYPQLESVPSEQVAR